MQVEKQHTAGDGPLAGPLELGTRKLRVILLPLLCMEAPLIVQFSHSGFDRVMGSVCAAFVALAALVAVAARLRMKRLGCVLRIDECGITVTGKRTIGWDEIRQVRVVRRGRQAFVVPIPREGLDLPTLDLGLFASSSGRKAARFTRRWGGPLVVVPAAHATSEDTIVAAVRRFGRGVPVAYEPAPLPDLPASL